MLKFNTFRSDRYLRAKFIEGRYFLASEASDLELELIDSLRRIVKTTIGDVAVDSAFEVKRLSQTQLLIKPGEAWFQGLPFRMRSGKDQLVSGASLTLGIVPPGITITDDSSGTGKILDWTTGVTPNGLYRIVISAQEQIITDVEDPFIKNANLTESTSQKIRLFYKINIVSDSVQNESPVPYTNDSNTYSTSNLVNRIVITPNAGQNGEVLATNSVSGSSNIDGRDLELVVRNDPGVGGGVKIPNGATDQQVFYNGKLIDSIGNSYHINAIFNDTVATQVIIRLDKEVGQPNPTIFNGQSYQIVKRDVYATDDVNGSPVGRLFWGISKVDWNGTYGFVHDSRITDLRERIIDEETFEDIVNEKFNIRPTGGGVIDVDTDGETLNWSADFNLIQPSGPSQTIAAGSAVLLDGGTLTYRMNFAGGLIAVGNLAVTVASNAGNNVTLSGSPDLSLVKIGNVLKVGLEPTAITAIDNINKVLTVSPAITTTGAGTVYRDSFAEGTVKLSEDLYVLAIKKNFKIRVADTLELSAGESNAIYDVRTLYPAGLVALTSIIIPNNSITGKSQYYTATKRNLEVFLNQQLKFQGVDWLAIDSQTIRFVYDLPLDSEIHYRMDSLPAGSVGGGGTGGGVSTLQDAYDGGNTISTSPGLPFTVTGSGKIADFQGDITVTGVIDPKGITFDPQASNPLGVNKGLWVNTSNHLIYQGTTTSDISQRLDDLESGASIPITGGAGLTRTGNDLSVNVDGSTLEINADTLRVKDLGITTAKLAAASVDENKLNTSVAGNGLSGGSGSPLSVNTDGATLEINADTLRVKDLGITTAKLNNNAVTDTKLSSDATVDANRAVGTDHIKDTAVTSAKLATAVAGNGLSGGAGSPLAVNVDNSTLEITTDTLNVKAAGITETHLNTSVAGNGLAGGSGSPLSVNVDNSTLEINADALRVKDAGITLAKMSSNSVDESKITASVAGAGLVGGGGSPLAVGAGTGIQVNVNDVQVISSPATKISVTVGEAFAANISYLVRWAITGETAGRVYKATAAVATNKKYLVIGVLLSTGALSAGDPATVLLEGISTLGSGDTPFPGGDAGKELFLKNDGSGGFSTSAPTTVGNAQFRVGVIQDTSTLLVDLKELVSVVPEPVYDERTLFAGGLSSGTDITLPVNSRNGGAAETYIGSEGRLKIFLNQVFKFQGIDWTLGTSTTTQIKFNYDLPPDSEVHFRIEPLSSGTVTSGGGGGGSGDLQDAYDAGSVINITSGVPLTINGPVSQKLLVINGDIDVTGIIDPIALQLTPQASNPLSGGQKGIWVDTSNNLMSHDGSTSINVTQVVAGVADGTGITVGQKVYLNSTGVTISSFTPVYSPTMGTIAPADGTDLNKYRVIGITTETISNGNSGKVALFGTVAGISGTHNRYLYLGLSPGSLTDVGPSLGGYPSGFQVIRLGVVEGTNLILQIQHMGVL